MTVDGEEEGLWSVSEFLFARCFCSLRCMLNRGRVRHPTKPALRRPRRRPRPQLRGSKLCLYCESCSLLLLELADVDLSYAVALEE